MKKPKVRVVRTGVVLGMTKSQKEIVHTLVKDRGLAPYGYDNRVLSGLYTAGLVTSVSVGNVHVPNVVRLKAYWTKREIAALKAALTR